MDLRQSVKLSTNWSISSTVSLNNVLYIKDNRGITIEQPLGNEMAINLPILTQPDTTTAPCYLYIDTTQLRGYIAVGIWITSESKTVEWYDKEEYIGTRRGTIVTQSEEETNDDKLYECRYSIIDTPVQHKCTMKLLSLVYKQRVKIKQLCLIVTEDHGGTKEKEPVPIATSSDPLQEIIPSDISLKIFSFFPTLLSALQQLQNPQEVNTTTPADISQMAAAFRQMRPETSIAKRKEDTVCSEGADNDAITDAITGNGYREDNTEVDSNGVATSDSELERRLKQYIDSKFEELNEKMEEYVREIVHNELSKLCEK